jgi:hypothetical protein
VLLLETPLTYDQGSRIFIPSCFQVFPRAEGSCCQTHRKTHGKEIGSYRYFHIAYNFRSFHFSSYILFLTLNFFFAGDGGNDVSMIQAASVGIGIVGKEGKQASLAADFSITQVRVRFITYLNSYAVSRIQIR